MAFYQLLAGTKREFSSLYQAFLRQALFLRLLLYLGMWPMLLEAMLEFGHMQVF